MYYTDKPNVFPQQKLKIPYNILSAKKESFVLYIDSGNLKITNLDRLIFTKNGEFTI